MDYFLGNPPVGEIATLTDTEMHHCLKVLRHKVGDEIGITDGCGNLWVCQILDDNWNGKMMTAKVLRHELNHGERVHSITLICCGPEDLSRMEWLIEKAVELGVNRLIFTRSRRSGFFKMKEHRLNTLLRTALKQCGRSRLPDWTYMENLSDCLNELSGEEGIKILGNASGIPLRDLDQKTKNQHISLICGPEGDFTPEEYDLLETKGFISAALGKTRLRSETANIALLAWIVSRD